MKNNKGITLVALIITIIVMLILVAVSVGILINSDLLGTAEKAGNAWENADDHLENIYDKELIGLENFSEKRYKRYQLFLFSLQISPFFPC